MPFPPCSAPKAAALADRAAMLAEVQAMQARMAELMDFMAATGADQGPAGGGTPGIPQPKATAVEEGQGKANLTGAGAAQADFKAPPPPFVATGSQLPPSASQGEVKAQAAEQAEAAGAASQPEQPSGIELFTAALPGLPPAKVTTASQGSKPAVSAVEMEAVASKAGSTAATSAGAMRSSGPKPPPADGKAPPQTKESSGLSASSSDANLHGTSGEATVKATPQGAPANQSTEPAAETGDINPFTGEFLQPEAPTPTPSGPHQGIMAEAGHAAKELDKMPPAPRLWHPNCETTEGLTQLRRASGAALVIARHGGRNPQVPEGG
jgi:hypothetical protein